MSSSVATMGNTPASFHHVRHAWNHDRATCDENIEEDQMGNMTNDLDMRLSRRDFLAASGVAAGAVVGASPALAQEASSSQTTSELAPTPWGGFYPWEAEPPVITDDMVEEVLDTDVVVIGMGVAGCAAFRAAAEAGAKVIGIEKSWTNLCRSNYYSYFNGKLTEHFEMPMLDLDAIIAEEYSECGCMTNLDIFRKFVYGDAEAMDWWIEGSGARVCEPGEVLPWDATEHAVCSQVNPSIDWENERQASCPDYLFFPNHQAVLDNNVQRGIDASEGSTVLYEHKAIELIRDEAGRVCGVYALNHETDKYKRVNASAGVVLASGCCRSNEKMMQYFAPDVLRYHNANFWPNVDAWGEKTNTGDGYKMGYWVGASIQQNQCPMVHVMGGPGDDDDIMNCSGFTGPLLRINYDGKRFMNEDSSAADSEYPIELQPKSKCFVICDAHAEEQALQCINTGFISFEYWDSLVGNGVIFKGDTLEELLSSIDGMDVEAAIETITHYNEMCAAAEGLDPYDTSADSDYHKKAKYLWPVVDGPFYAQRMGVGPCLVMMGGIESNTEAQALDIDHMPVPGLFVAGNIQGNRFAVKYPYRLAGHSHAMAMFYGKVAGENAAKGM